MDDRPVVVAAGLCVPPRGATRTAAAPLTEDEVIADALAAWDAGAAVLRLRPWAVGVSRARWAERFARIGDAIRAQGCDAIVAVACAADADLDGPDTAAEPLDACALAALRPELVSVARAGARPRAGGLDGLRRAASAAAGAGAALEIECSGEDDVERVLALRAQGWLADPLRFQLAVDDRGGERAVVERLMRMAALVGDGALWSGGGSGLTQIRANTAALLAGGHLRTGLEDNPWLVEGVPATNEELVARLVRVVDELDRPLATPAEAREIFAVGGSADRLAVPAAGGGLRRGELAVG